MTTYICGGGGTYAARAWAALNPGVDMLDPDLVDCESSAYGGAAACTCWEAVYAVGQADPVRPSVDRLELPARPARCSDCAYRRDSPERADGFESERLDLLPGRGQPFWCHDGMRRPVAWRHPTRGEVPADPDDWEPPQIDGVPYRADGSPALLCAGWASLRAKVVAG